MKLCGYVPSMTEPACAQKYVTAAGQEVVEEGHAVGHLCRVVEVQQHGRWAQPHAFCLSEYSSNEHFRADDRLPRHRVVFANPELIVAEILSAERQLHVLIVTLFEWFIG